MKTYTTHEKINSTKQELLHRMRTLVEIQDKCAVETEKVVDSLCKVVGITTIKLLDISDLIKIPKEINKEERTIFFDQLKKLTNVVAVIRSSQNSSYDYYKDLLKQLEEFDAYSVKIPMDRTELIKNNGLKKSNVAIFVRNLKKRVKADGNKIISHEIRFSFLDGNGDEFPIGHYTMTDLSNDRLDRMITNAYINNHVYVYIRFFVKQDKEEAYMQYPTRSVCDRNLDDPYVIWKTDSQEALTLFEFNNL